MSNKEQMVKAMHQVFGQKGYLASINDVSEIIGLKAPAIYNRFSNKDELIYHAVLLEIETFRNKMVEVLKSKQEFDFGERVKCFLEGLMDYFLEDGRVLFWKYIFMIPNAELAEKCQKAVRIVEEENRLLISNIFEEGVISGVVEERYKNTAQLMFHVISQGSINLIYTGIHHELLKSNVNDLSDIFIKGISKDNGSSR